MKVSYKLMPYKHGLWCVGKNETEVIDVTCKDSFCKQEIDGFTTKKLVFKGSLQECESFLKRQQ